MSIFKFRRVPPWHPCGNFLQAKYKMAAKLTFDKKWVDGNMLLIQNIKYFLTIFTGSVSKTARSMIYCHFTEIGSHLSDIWPFYGQKLPWKTSFSLYIVQSNYPNSLNKMNFIPNLVFPCSIRTTRMDHGQIKNLKKKLFLQNRIFLPPTPKLWFSLK